MLTQEQVWELHLDLQRHKKKANGKKPARVSIKNSIHSSVGNAGLALVPYPIIMFVLTDYYLSINLIWRAEKNVIVAVMLMQPHSISIFGALQMNILTWSEHGIDLLMDVNSYNKNLRHLIKI